METVRAKLTVTGTTLIGDNETVYMSAQYDGNKPEDNTYAAATPSASVVLTVSNPSVHGFFKQGQKYYVDFQAVEQ